MFKKLGTSEDLSNIFNSLFNPDSDVDSVVSHGIALMQFIYGKVGETLTAACIKKYNTMLAKNNLAPERLPPTNGAAKQHLYYLVYCNTSSDLMNDNMCNFYYF